MPPAPEKGWIFDIQDLAVTDGPGGVPDGARVALFQLRQIQPGAKVLAVARQHGGAHGVRQVLKGVTQCGDEAVGQRVALGAACQTHDGNLLVVAGELDRQIRICHWHGVSLGCIMIMNNN